MRAEDAEYVEVDGHRLRIRRSGPPGGEPVLLVHGIGRSLEDWTRTHDLLAVDHRVVSVDLPGFGLTRRWHGRRGLPGFVEALVALLDTLGERRPVHLMGNSLGGAVCMALTAEHPDRVASLVLVNSAGFGRRANVSALPMAYGALSVLPVVGRRFRRLATQAGIRSIQDIFHDPEFVTDEMLRLAGEVTRQPDYRTTFVTTALTLGAPLVGLYPGWRRALLERIAEAEVPVLVVWGETDKVLPATHFEAAVAALPRARGHLFPETGHMPQIERAEEFAELVTAFLAEAATGRGVV